MISEKENMRRFYAHEDPEWMPEFGVGAHFLFPHNGTVERPRDNIGGTDWFGVEWVCKEGEPPVPDITKPHVLTDITKWREQVTFPDLDAWDWEAAAEMDGIDKIDRANTLLYMSSLEGLFERLHALMGFENAMIAMVRNKKDVAEFFDAMTEYKCKKIDKLAQYYKPDILNFHDDWGTQKALFMSPKMWRELLKPRMKQIVERAHRHGMYFEMHSCGYIQDIIPDIAEIGVDCLQCMNINDIRAAKAVTGKKMAYNVAFNEQKHYGMATSGAMTEEFLRNEIHDEVMTLGEGGCYFPFYLVTDDPWVQILHDEVNKCRVLLGKQ